MGERFTETISTGIVTDTVTGKEYKCEMRIDDEFLGLVNDIAKENEQLKKEIENNSALFKEVNRKRLQLEEENEQLKQLLNEAVNQIHLVHMQSMFSTVRSFKGDVSKRYRYSKENDTIYDTANNYGQYDQVLDKAEIVMLLNEYETVLNELKGD